MIFACWQNATSSFRDIFLIQRQKQNMVSKWPHYGSPAQTTLTLWGAPAMEILNQICEQSSTNGLMATQTCCNPNLYLGQSMALRSNEQISKILNWEESKGKAALILVMLLCILRSVHGQKSISDTQ